jgi:hypothetical protein
MMKRVLRSASSTVREGVGSSEHDPRARETTPSLFSGLYEVEERLLRIYAGREIRFGALLQEEAYTQFTESNYRDALLKLEDEGRVIVDPPPEKRRLQAGGKKRALPKDASIRVISKGKYGE